MQTRNLPLMNDYATAILLISEGIDIWTTRAASELKSFKTQYLTEFSALPTNTHFVERGVKESGYALLGRRNETNCIVLDIARGKSLSESLKRDRDEIQSNDQDDRKQLHGEPKTKVLLTEMIQHYIRMSATKSEYISFDEFNLKIIQIKNRLPTTHIS